MSPPRSVNAQTYTEAFFARQFPNAVLSAREVVPLVCELIPISSVVDVGCGVGAWLSVFREHRVTDVLGLDGDYVRTEQLLIPSSQFRPVDLTAPPRLGRTFDLAVSLEVAEHLPAAAAERFVEYLTDLAPIVVFSAAIPGQGGANHINEQWPEYWVEKFQRHGFVVIDGLRFQLWENARIEWWYVQNTLIFARRDTVGKFPRLRMMAEQTDVGRLAVVHPRAYKFKCDELAGLVESIKPENAGFRWTLARLPASLRGAIRRRLGWLSVVFGLAEHVLNACLS